MANEALKKIRDELSGGRNMTTEYLRDLVDQAIAHAVEEATSQPAHQFAEHQARLVKAKADKAEWELYMATEGLRVPSFVEEPSAAKPLEVCINGLRFFVNKPTDAVSDGQGNTTMTASIGVDVQSAEPFRRISMDVFDADWPKPVADPGIADSLLADQNAKRDERLKRAIAQQDERRILGLASDVADHAKRIEEAELRGFYKGRNQALREVINIQQERVAHGYEAFSVLMDIKRAITFIQKEG